ncbi:uncharacterized protein LOC125492811 [Beta vulgaris subsp. vulgaris]|uniref:uncharacterized protein LOC125492811 n=1 Tax=Beta vulgaris subsp. vulgaris TaxID=3555 RepID=UPI0020368CBB|nr:uncharacterized protein LOC125492811 [Beta vulgaris subsp. vulgaris]
MDIFPKWKLFLWKILNHALPTTDNLIKRKIREVNPIYCLCNMQDETMTHLFRDCEITQRIWRSSMGITANQGTHLLIPEWIKNFLNLFRKRKKENRDIMEIEFISTLWGIWLHRNEVIFKDSSTNPKRIMEITKENIMRAKNRRSQRDSRLEENVEANNKEPDWEVGQKRSINVQSLVVDGAWKKNAKSNQWQAAIAWKNLNNDPREEFVGKIFATSPVQTEAYAVMKALSDMQWRCSELIIKTDNREIIQALKNPRETNKDIDNIIKDIRRLANSFNFVCCKKVKREEVNLAHNLAIKARKS